MNRRWLLVVSLLVAGAGCGTKTPCDASRCASGCCDEAGECQLGTSASACGSSGRACVSCSGAQRCAMGVCSTGAGGGDGGPMPVVPTIAINELAVSDGDFVELLNVGTAPVDLSGLRLADLDSTTMGPKLEDAYLFPPSTTLAPGAYLVIAENADGGLHDLPFGLSSGGDKVFLVDSVDRVLLEQVSPASPHPSQRSYGRLPNGTGAFVATLRTPGLPNQPIPEVVDAGRDAGVSDGGLDAGAFAVVVNEIAFNNGDFAELFNTGPSIDLSGYVLADLDTASGGPKLSSALTLPSGTTLAAQGHLVFREGTPVGPATSCLDDGGVGACFFVGFGLSPSGDAIFLINPAGTVVSEARAGANVAAADKSWGRIPDGTGAFVETRRTPGEANRL